MASITTHVQDGLIVDYTPAADTAQGAVVVQEELVGVMVRATSAGELGAIDISSVFDFPKTAATAYDAGKKVYWDVADQEATEDDDTGTNKYIGKVIKAALAADTTVRVKLDQ